MCPANQSSQTTCHDLIVKTILVRACMANGFRWERMGETRFAGACVHAILPPGVHTWYTWAHTDFRLDLGDIGIGLFYTPAPVGSSGSNESHERCLLWIISHFSLWMRPGTWNALHKCAFPGQSLLCFAWSIALFRLRRLSSCQTTDRFSRHNPLSHAWTLEGTDRRRYHYHHVVNGQCEVYLLHLPTSLSYWKLLPFQEGTNKKNDGQNVMVLQAGKGER